MDEMEDWEVNDIIENLPYLDRNDWERSRLQVYSNVQMNTKKKLKPNDILEFPWDNKEENTSISNEDIDRLKRKSEMIRQQIITETNGK